MSLMGSHVSGLWSSGTTGLSQVQRSALGERRSLVAAHQTRSQSVQENSRQPALRSSLCSSGIADFLQTKMQHVQVSTALTFALLILSTQLIPQFFDLRLQFPVFFQQPVQVPASIVPLFAERSNFGQMLSVG